MNFIDRFRIKINPNIIDSFDERKLSSDVISYAIQCGYKFNPDTFRNFISNQNFQEAFKEQHEVFEYMKNDVLSRDDDTSKKEFARLYCRNGRNMEEYISLIKGDDELSEDFAKKIESWMKNNVFFTMKSVIQIIDGKDELLDEILQSHFDTIKENMSFREFAEYIACQKSPQEVYDFGIRNSDLDIAFINTANPQKFVELFNNFDKKQFTDYKSSYTQLIEENTEQFILYLDRLDEKYKRQTQESFITTDIKSKVLAYLKENKISYNENIPKFALEDNEYVIQCIRTKSTSFITNWRITKF